MLTNMKDVHFTISELEVWEVKEINQWIQQEKFQRKIYEYLIIKNNTFTYKVYQYS